MKKVICEQKNVNCSDGCDHSKPHEYKENCIYGLCYNVKSNSESKLEFGHAKCIDIRKLKLEKLECFIDCIFLHHL